MIDHATRTAGYSHRTDTASARKPNASEPVAKASPNARSSEP
jgi:hypothetical protein